MDLVCTTPSVRYACTYGTDIASTNEEGRVTATLVQQQYTATPEAAWALIGDFEGIAKLFPAITDVTIEGDVRTFSMMGMRISERLVRRDDATRTLTYAIVDGVPIETHEATMVVAPSDGGCTISWSVTTTPEDAQPLFSDTYARALESLHAALDQH
jgi:Polyketide cyclase / dehydrase and lipid transport